MTAAPVSLPATGAQPGLAPAWQLYICVACGYIYNEALGDPDGGLAPGTRFADIPDDWACPLCGVTKRDFEPYLPAAPRRGGGATASAVQGRRQQAGVVIVGAGRAGWQLAEELRQRDAALPITLVSDCAGDLYDKPLLSVAMARQLLPSQLVKESGAAAAQRLGVRLLAQTHAISICAGSRQLRTTRGTLRYDRLVLAHGAQAMLAAPLNPRHCWTVNHLAAYQQLRQRIDATGQPRELLIVGAGLVGSELANDLALAGHHITLLDVQTTPLARWPAEQAGTQLLQAWEALPIRFVGGVQVADITQEPSGRYAVRTACGQCFEVDQVIAATGLQTPSRLATSAALLWDNGIAVEPRSLCTSDPNIHALGDCITVAGQASRYIEPITRQARCIAAAITGGAAEPYEAKAALVRVKTTSHPLTLH